MEFSVNIRKMQAVGDSLSSLRDRVDDCVGSVISAESRLPFSDDENETIRNVLKAIADNISAERELINAMSAGVNNAATKYFMTENRLCGRDDIMLDHKMLPPFPPIPPIMPVFPKDTGETWFDKIKKKAKENGVSWKWSDTWGIVAESGVIGGVISTIGNIATGDIKDPKTWLKSGKFVAKFIGKGAEAVKDGSVVKWAAKFGKKIKVGDGAVETAGKVKTATKWAGYLLTVATNGVENYNEYKKGDISGKRAVAETVVESAVDIGIGIAASALIGTIGAPAVVAGAMTVGVVWAANAASKYFFNGRDLGEVAADAVCDLGTKAIDAGKKAVTKTVDTAKKATKAVVNAGKGAVKALKSAGGGVKTAWRKACSIF